MSISNLSFHIHYLDSNKYHNSSANFIYYPSANPHHISDPTKNNHANLSKRRSEIDNNQELIFEGPPRPPDDTNDSMTGLSYGNKDPVVQDVEIASTAAAISVGAPSDPPLTATPLISTRTLDIIIKLGQQYVQKGIVAENPFTQVLESTNSIQPQVTRFFEEVAACDLNFTPLIRHKGQTIVSVYTV